MKIRYVLVVLATWCVSASAQEMPFQVQLKTPLSTSSSRKGDPVSAVVLSPEAFKGDLITGEVTESRSGKHHREAVLRFSFETLEHGGASVPVASSITSISNSKGEADVDEGGSPIHKGSNVAKALGSSGFGGLVGGLMHSSTGGAIASGASEAVSKILIQVEASAPQMELSPGSTFGLSVKSRSGPELASLKPNTAATSTPQPISTAANASPVAAAGVPATEARVPENTGGQPLLAASKVDFIPGEKTLFYDDFSDMASDEPPPHWMVRGAAVELRTGGNVRQLTAPGNSSLRTPKLEIPKNFTLEVELMWPDEVDFSFGGEDACRNSALNVHLQANPGFDKNQILEEVRTADGSLGNPKVPADVTKPVSFALWVQDGRLRTYIDGSRGLDVNQVDIPQTYYLCMQLRADRAPVGVRSVRLAQSAPDFSTEITATGHYVTHGVYFDTDSAILKPESAAVIKTVARGLEKNPNLKLEIDGYTDSTGDAQHNLELSKERAEAVESVLVQQFGVNRARLFANGFGPEKPIASNDTPDGRAQNRRVEFIRQ